MDEVARVAGVSPSTVSLYLRRPDAVSATRGQRIQAAVDRLGYVPNTMAGGLASARSRIVGVLVPTLGNSFFSATVDWLERDLRRAGYQVLIGNTEFDPAIEEALIRSMMSWSPAGLVVTGFEHTRQARSLLLGSDVPIVEMWDYGPDAIDMSVGFAHEQCGRRIARHLLERDYRQAAFIGPAFARDVRAEQRYTGFRDAMQAAGGHVALAQLTGPTDTGEVGTVLRSLIAERPGTHAICCANDMVALGVMFECQRQGWAIPERLAIAGFGNLEFTPNTVPPLTTIEPPKYTIGERAATLLLQRLRGEDVAGERARVDLGVELIVRDSA